jgi:tetratricopeptide (TPR) repeat protein
MSKDQFPMTNGKRWSLVIATWTLVISLTGCAQLPLPWRTRPGLPSPQATIAAAEKENLAAAAQTPASERQSVGAEGADVSQILARGRALERSRHYDKAYKAYKTALAQHPGNTLLLHRLGIVADGQKKHAEAEQFFLTALQDQPRNAELLGDLGYCYYLQGKLDKAASALSKAVTLDPAHSRHRNNLGLVLGLQRDYDGAFDQFSAAGSEADAYYNMAFIFAAQDLPEEAVGCFQEALVIDPAHEWAQHALAAFTQYEQALTDEGGPERAVASGVRYVPYIETAESGHGDGEVQPAAASESIPASRHAGRATRTLQLQSRGLLNRHLQSQRSDE